MHADPLWTVTETNFDPQHQNHSETLFTTGNGYLSTRGAMEEGFPGERRTTFLTGVFDHIPIVLTELANAPDWLELHILLSGEFFRLDQGTLLNFTRSIDLRNGLLTRTVRWRSPQGRTTRLEFERFSSLAEAHLNVLRVRITPEDYAGTVEIHAGINGEVDNEGYKHWEWLGQAAHNGSLWLHTRTRGSHIQLGQAARLTLSGPSPSSQMPGTSTTTPPWYAAPPSSLVKPPVSRKPSPFIHPATCPTQSRLLAPAWKPSPRRHGITCGKRTRGSGKKNGRPAM